MEQEIEDRFSSVAKFIGGHRPASLDHTTLQAEVIKDLDFIYEEMKGFEREINDLTEQCKDLWGSS